MSMSQTEPEQNEWLDSMLNLIVEKFKKEI